MKTHFGNTIKKRAKYILASLMMYDQQDSLAENELDLELKWKQSNEFFELWIQTELQTLEFLVKQYNFGISISKSQIREAIQRLSDLELIADHRFKTQGSKNWVLAIKLPSKDSSRNLTWLEQEWEKRKLLVSQKQKFNYAPSKFETQPKNDKNATQ